MARHRLGVVVLVPQPLATEIDGIRRALGDRDRERIPPHITLVPPVNVNDRELLNALDVVRAAGEAAKPFTLHLGPATTFHPVTPTVYLEVGGDLDDLVALRTGVFRPPLERELEHPFVPHLTLDADHAADRISQTLAALRDFAVDLTVDRVVVLRQGDDRVWKPFSEAPLGPAATVARGGLPLELTVSGRLDPEAAALLAVDGVGDGEPFAITARRDGRASARRGAGRADRCSSSRTWQWPRARETRESAGTCWPRSPTSPRGASARCSGWLRRRRAQQPRCSRPPAGA